MSRSISLDVELAKSVGIAPAIVYNELLFWNKKGRREDGWIYKSYEEITERLPLSEQTIRRAYKTLVDRNLIKTKIMKVDNAPTLHYKLIESETANLAETIETAKLAETTIYTLSNTSKIKKEKGKSTKEKSEVLKNYYLVVKKYGLPVINHDHIKKWSKDLESLFGEEIALLYLVRIQQRDLNDESMKDEFVPQITRAIDVLNKSQQIIQYLKKTKNTASTPVNIEESLEREKKQEEEAKRIREM